MCLFMGPEVVDPSTASLAFVALKTARMPMLTFDVSLETSVVAEVLLARVTLEVSTHSETWEPASKQKERNKAGSFN